MTDRVWDFEQNGPAGPVVPPVPPTRPVPPSAPPSAPSFGSPPLMTPAVTSIGYGQPTQDPAPRTSNLASPPIIGVDDQLKHNEANKKRTWPKVVAAFVAGGVVAGGSFSAGQYFSDEESAAQETTITVATGDTGETTEVPYVLPDAEDVEPAEYVAALLGPSIVQIETDLGVGSGIVFAEDMVITNHHVIEGATTITVRTSDGRTLSADLVGSDPQVDVAVLDLGEGSDLTVAALALDEEVHVGQSAFALGSPFELQQSISAGIVSAVNRPVSNGAGINAMIQSDTSVNPGNSGGALADRFGRVIGINTSIRTDGVVAGSVGISFSIPIDTATRVANRIINGESLEPGFLGVGNAQEAPNGESGVVIGEVSVGSGAEAAGIEIGDRLIRINGSPVTSLLELAGLVRASFPGDSVTLEVVRGTETLTVTATLGER